MRWADGQVFVDDSVLAPRPPSGVALRDRFFDGISRLTFNVIRTNGRSQFLGPLELLRFGAPETEARAVSWPIEGGLLAAAAGGTLELRAGDGELAAHVKGYRPRLPAALYSVTQLPVHHALVRLQLLRLRGRTPSSGIPADTGRRFAAAAVDLGICAAVAAMVGRKRPVRTLFAVTAGYHLACWSLSGHTVGGAIMRQRVVAVDGSRPSLFQSVLRLAALPIAAVRLRAVHDEVSATDVVED